MKSVQDRSDHAAQTITPLARLLQLRLRGACDQSQAVVALLAEAETVPKGLRRAERKAHRHVQGCLRCQRDLARTRKARAAVTGLNADRRKGGGTGVADVLAAIDDLPEVEPELITRKQAMFAGAGSLASALAALAIAAVVVYRRRTIS